MVNLNRIARALHLPGAQKALIAKQEAQANQSRVGVAENPRNWHQRAGDTLRTSAAKAELNIKSLLGMKIEISGAAGKGTALAGALSALATSRSEYAYGALAKSFAKAGADTNTTKQTVADAVSRLTNVQLLSLSRNLEYNRIPAEDSANMPGEVKSQTWNQIQDFGRTLEGQVSAEMSKRHLGAQNDTTVIHGHAVAGFRKALSQCEQQLNASNNDSAASSMDWNKVEDTYQISLKSLSNAIHEKNGLASFGKEWVTAETPAQTVTPLAVDPRHEKVLDQNLANSSLGS